MDLEGYIDVFGDHEAQGWIRDRENPKTRLTVELNLNGTPRAQIVADIARPDLLEAGIDDCRYGFHLHFPVNVADIPKASVRVSVAGTPYFFSAQVGSLEYGAPFELLVSSLSKESTTIRGIAKRFRRGILHIGCEKTGSTSIQAFLGMNAQQLKNIGYLTPRSLASASGIDILNHDWLSALCMGDLNFSDNLRVSRGLTNSKNLQQARERKLKEFFAEIETAPANCHTLLLSNEHCHSRLQSFAEVDRVRMILSLLCDEISIVVFLRQQHALAISQYSMFVCNGIVNVDVFPPLPPPADYKKAVYTRKSYFDYAALLARWKSVFTKARIVPVLYDAGCNVVPEYLKIIGVEPVGLQIPNVRLNEGISATGVAFLTKFFTDFPPEPGTAAAFFRERVRNAARLMFRGSGRRPAKAAVITFMSQFEEGNENIRLDWFPQRHRLFADDFCDYPEVETRHMFAADQFCSLVYQLFKIDQELLFGLTAETINRLHLGQTLDSILG